MNREKTLATTSVLSVSFALDARLMQRSMPALEDSKEVEANPFPSDLPRASQRGCPIREAAR
jgi:hypothetical protein